MESDWMQLDKWQYFLFPSPPTGPLSIVFLSEAKDLACWLLNIAV
jgi:hypothetical protein